MPLLSFIVGIRTESGQTLLQLTQQRKQAESTIPDMIFDGKQGSSFGFMIACGDVDGDGHDDILIGAVGENDSRGRVYLFCGGPDMDTTADLILEGQEKGERFGTGTMKFCRAYLTKPSTTPFSFGRRTRQK